MTKEELKAKAKEIIVLPNDYTYEFGEVERVVITGSNGVI